jgi:hypothetical protein
MEITAALFLPIAPPVQAATEPSQLLFTAILNEAASMEPAEPSAWTLLNPMVAPEEGDTTLSEPAEPREEPPSSDEVVFVPPQQPILVTKPPLQFQFLSKELTEGVKKLPLESAEFDRAFDHKPISSSGGDGLLNLAPEVDKPTATPEQQPQSDAGNPQYVAFTARVSKPRTVPDAADTGLSLKPLQRSVTSENASELRLSKPASEAENTTAERPVSFVQTPQFIDIEKPAEDTPVQTTKAPTPVSEQMDTSSADPVRRISFDVEGTEGQLRIRIAERAGEMRAWVTGQTPATVEKVQAGLSDLTRALTNAGFESEVWAPHVVSTSASASDLQASTEQSDRNQYGGSHSETGDNHRGGSQHNRRSHSDDDDDEFNFRSHLRIS